MAVNRLLRSPQFISATGGTGTLSAKLTIITDGSTVPTYTLIKDADASTPTTFDYSELARDYLNIASPSGSVPANQSVFLINLVLNFWDAANAGGSQVGSDTTLDVNGFDGYGTFYEGANPDMITTEFPAISNYSQVIGGTKTYTVFAPKNTTLVIPSINGNGAGTVKYNNSSFNGTDVTINSIVVNINRIDCTKYTSSLSGYTESIDDTGYPVLFINKYGAIQTEYFTLKTISKISSSRKSYNSNIVTASGGYSINQHTKLNLDIQGKQEYTFNSFYLPEYYNNVFAEMLLSEKIWVRFRVPSTNTFTNVPINIKTSSFTNKNSLNDKLIQFTFTFDMSFDYINNIR